MSPRILNGEIIGSSIWEWPEGPEPRIAVRLPGGIWDIPSDWFTGAGHTVLEVGTRFKAETPTPVGLVPKRLERILPPEPQLIENHIES